MASFEDAFNNYKNSGQGAAIAGLQDAQTQAELNGLKAAYDQNLATQQAAREQIGTSYRAAGNSMQAQFERDRRNLNQQAAANGLNTGAGSQQQLALQNVWNRDYGTLQGQQARAYADADLAIANLQTNYQNAIQQAQAQGDYRKMAALLDDYNTQYNRQVQQAQLLAQYGDFSGYNGIYSSEQIQNMRDMWIASNPLLAYNTGAIDAATYKRMTGYDPHGTTSSASSGGGYYGGGSYSGGSDGSSGDGGTGSEADVAGEGGELPTWNPAMQWNANFYALVDKMRTSGATPQQIDEAAKQAAEMGLIPRGSESSLAAAGNNATSADRERARYAAAHGDTSPSTLQRAGWTPAQAAYAQRQTAAAGANAGNSYRNIGG